MAEALVGSEILAIAAEIRALRGGGAEICNLTVGDFDPAEFRIPDLLEQRIDAALKRGETNYPPSDGLPALRAVVASLYERELGLAIDPKHVVITGGSRPGIYATFQTLVDPGDRVVYPIPSWNNNHYVHLSGAEGVPVQCGAGDAFLPTPAVLEKPLRGARLLALNSPLNPAGTAFSARTLGDICDLVLEENERRAPGERPLYIMYDQVYWMLTFGSVRHVDPVSLRPEIERYTIYVDGISKSLAATGVRVGWIVAPGDLVPRFAGFLGHVGAWAPRAEQVATAEYLDDQQALNGFRAKFVAGLQARLDALHDGLLALAAEGLPIETIPPMGAIYLSARFPLHGTHDPSGETLRTNEQIRRYLLREAGLAMVPFQAFGMRDESGWFRLSVGAVSIKEIGEMLPRLRHALRALAPGSARA